MRKLYFSFLAVLSLFLFANQSAAQAPVITPEVEPNGTSGTAQVLNLSSQNCTIVSGSIPAGDLDFFRIDGVAAGSRIWIATDPGGTQNPGATSRDPVMDLLAADGTTVIENDDDDGTGNGGDGTIETGLASMIGGRTLTAGGTYYIRLRAFSGTAIIDPYRIFIVVTASGAGAPEVESNNTSGTANSLVTGSNPGIRTGAIGAAGDVDMYSVVTQAGHILHINTDADPERDGTGTDLVVELVAPDGTTILISFDSSISGSLANPAAEGGNFIITTSGTYYIRVRHFSASSTGTYHLMVTSAQASVAATPCAENFDGVVAPALPASWTTDATGIGIPWVTSTTNSFSAPNNAFGPETSDVGVTNLTSRVFPIVSPTAQLTFRNLFNLESGFDGMVLEISTGGGAYQDIITAGGSFVTGGYTGTLSTGFGNPLPGRQAWTGLSGGTTAAPTYILTTINLPAGANGQNIQLKWRTGSDNSVIAGGANGSRIDDIAISGSLCGGGCAGTPSAGSIAGPTTACVGNSVTLTLSGQSTDPGNTIQWKSSLVPGGPYTNIAGANAANYTFTAVAGTRYYIATVTCVNGGASANTTEYSVAVGAPVHSLVSSTVTTVCTPGTATITGTVSGGVLQGSSVLGTSGTINLAIPDGSPTGASNTIAVSAAPAIPTAADLKVRINASHTFVGDLRFTLTSPCGTTFLFDRPGVPPGSFGNGNNLGTTNAASNPPPAVYTFDLAAATIIPETALGSGFIPAGSYRPSDAAGAAHNWAGLTFPCAVAGNWQLTVVDNAAGDVGTLVSWQILGPAVYTHTLTGPGTITQNPSTGAGNSTANFTVSNQPAGVQTYTLTSTDGIGCSIVSTVTALFKQTPIITLVPAAPVICNGTIQQITASVVPPTLQAFAQTSTTIIPNGSPSTTAGVANPYPSQINVSGLPATGVSVKSVKLGNFNHSFPDDVDIVLVSPSGQSVILMSDAGGGAPVAGPDYILDDAAASLMADNALNPQGTYRPTNFGAGDNWPAPGPLGAPSATTLSTFSGNPNGNWSLYIVDDANGDAGSLGNWEITFNIPSLVVFSPLTGLYSNALATIPYTGTPTNVVYARPNITTLYTATSTVDGCTGTATVNVTVNDLPAITVQPTPATQTICPGFNVTYSVTATGTGITYQWKRNGTNLVNNAQVSGVTTNTLSITNVNAGNSGSYTVEVSGVCPPPVTSNAVVLNVATAPVISTPPANRTVCVGQSASFTVATVGSIPPPTIYQWESSPDGITWTPLTTGGSYTATFTIPATVIGQNNTRYRVRVTNSCGQSTTSASATLTVNALPTVTAAALTQRICISDTLVPLSGSPVGGSWSGIGVSGFNFVPTATAVGTYNLTYTYTNAAGCTSTATIVAKVEDCQERLRLLRDDALILYPNPNNGKFNIRVNSTLYNYIGMKVYNVQGQLLNGVAVNDVLNSPVYSGLVYGRVIPIDLSHLPAGIYMVKFFYDDGVRTSEKTFKVVIGAH